MPIPRIQILLCLAAMAAAVPLEAADFALPRPEIKLRLGYGLSQKDGLRSGSLNYGVAFNFETALGELSAELGYNYKTGDKYAGAFQADPAGKQAIDTRNSVEEKRNDLKGFNLRLGIGRRIADSDLGWQAGVMFGGTQFRQEYVGDVRSLSWTSTTATAWRDTFNGTPSRGGLTTSPFATLQWQVNKVSSLDVGVLLLNYKALDYIHLPGSSPAYKIETDTTGKPTGPLSAHNDFPGDRLDVKTRWTPHIEVGWTFRF